MNISIKIIFNETDDKSFEIIKVELLKELPRFDEYTLKRNVYSQLMLVLNRKSNITEVPVKLVNNIIKNGLTLNTIISEYELP